MYQIYIYILKHLTYKILNCIIEHLGVCILYRLFRSPYYMNTYMADTASQQWYVVDVTNKVLGRLASELAKRLRGKHKPEYTPHADTGDYIIILNASHVRVSGNKIKDKLYHRHTGYPGGLKSMNFAAMQAKHPKRLIRYAVKGMLPKGPLGRKMLRKLKVYTGNYHPHQAQRPKAIDL